MVACVFDGAVGSASAGQDNASACVLLKRKKAESEAQRGRPKGTLESGVRVRVCVYY